LEESVCKNFSSRGFFQIKSGLAHLLLFYKKRRSTWPDLNRSNEFAKGGGSVSMSEEEGGERRRSPAEESQDFACSLLFRGEGENHVKYCYVDNDKRGPKEVGIGVRNR